MKTVVSIYKMSLAQKIEALESFLGLCPGRCNSLPPSERCLSCIAKDGLQRVADVVDDIMKAMDQAYPDELETVCIHETDADEGEEKPQTLMGVPIHWTQKFPHSDEMVVYDSELWDVIAEIVDRENAARAAKTREDIRD